MMQTITYEEQQLMSIYGHGTRLELIQTLNDMRTYLDQDEQELRDLTNRAIAKLNAMTDWDSVIAVWHPRRAQNWNLCSIDIQHGLYPCERRKL